MSLKDLPFGVHLVMNFCRVRTGAGVRIRFETVHSTCFLPVGNTMSDELIADLNGDVPVVISLRGPRDQMVIYLYHVLEYSTYATAG